MVSKKKLRLIIVFVIFIISTAYISAIGIANIFNYKLDYFDINPNEKSYTQVINIVYPNKPMVGLLLFGNESENNFVENPLISLHICLNYSGTLVEGKKVDISAIGYVYPEGQNIISDAIVTNNNVRRDYFNYTTIVGFEGASIYNESNTSFLVPEGQFPVQLQKKDKFGYIPKETIPSWPLYQTIKWDTQGEYYPYILVPFKDNSIITESYTNYKIHVGDPNIIRQQENSRINIGLTYALLGLTVILCIQVLFDSLPDEINLNFLRRKNNKDGNYDETPNNESQLSNTERPPP